MPPVFIHSSRKWVLAYDFGQVVRVKIKEAHPCAFCLFEGLGLGTKKGSPYGFKVGHPANKEDLVMFGCKVLKAIGHTSLSPEVCMAFF